MKILVNGCSFTALKNQWPAFFPLPHTNISIGGNSNENIFLTTVEELQRHNYDCCIIMWSFNDRYAMSTANHEIKNIMPNSPIGHCRGDDHLNPEEINGHLIEKALARFKKDVYKYFYSDLVQQRKLDVYRFSLTNSFNNVIHLSVDDFLNNTIGGIVDFDETNHPTAHSSERFAKHIMDTYFNE
jgi:hypothetical protein